MRRNKFHRRANNSLDRVFNVFDRATDRAVNKLDRTLDRTGDAIDHASSLGFNELKSTINKEVRLKIFQKHLKDEIYASLKQYKRDHSGFFTILRCDADLLKMLFNNYNFNNTRSPRNLKEIIRHLNNGTMNASIAYSVTNEDINALRNVLQDMDSEDAKAAFKDYSKATATSNIAVFALATFAIQSILSSVIFGTVQVLALSALAAPATLAVAVSAVYILTVVSFVFLAIAVVAMVVDFQTHDKVVNDIVADRNSQQNTNTRNSPNHKINNSLSAPLNSTPAGQYQATGAYNGNSNLSNRRNPLVVDNNPSQETGTIQMKISAECSKRRALGKATISRSQKEPNTLNYSQPLSTNLQLRAGIRTR